MTTNCTANIAHITQIVNSIKTDILHNIYNKLKVLQYFTTAIFTGAVHVMRLEAILCLNNVTYKNAIQF